MAHRLPSRRDGEWEIDVNSIDGTELHRVFNDPADDYHPAWSPDGQNTTFATDRDDNWGIYTMDIDGTNVTRLTTHPDADEYPAWMP